jgi:hypothetical protein
MNVNYDIAPTRQLVTLRFGGVGEFNVWQTTFQAAVADPRYRPGFAFLADRRGCPMPTRDDARQMARSVRQNAGRFANTKWAVDEADRATADAIRARALSASDTQLDFDVVRGVARRETISQAGLRSTVVRAIQGSTRTVVLVGDRTHASIWVVEEISATIAAGRPVRAIRLPNTTGPAPALLGKHRIPVEHWSLEQLQLLATCRRRRRKT